MIYEVIKAYRGLRRGQALKIENENHSWYSPGDGDIITHGKTTLLTLGVIKEVNFPGLDDLLNNLP